jgi:hypothetical protein
MCSDLNDAYLRDVLLICCKRNPDASDFKKRSKETSKVRTTVRQILVLGIYDIKM